LRGIYFRWGGGPGKAVNGSGAGDRQLNDLHEGTPLKREKWVSGETGKTNECREKKLIKTPAAETVWGKKGDRRIVNFGKR